MPITTASGTLQTATVIAKTTQTLIGAEIACGGYEYLTLFFDYVNGDETGLDIQAHLMQVSGGTAYQDVSWTAAAGTKTATLNEFNLSATANRYITFDIRGVEFVKFTQGGSTNDGTPTGTLAATYTLKG